MIEIKVERLTTEDQKTNGGRCVAATIFHHGEFCVLMDSNLYDLMNRVSEEVRTIVVDKDL
jgi:hypothetical protein